ncbi:MAG: transposase [Minicystis sp.]
MANVLPAEKRLQVLAVTFGIGAQNLHNRVARDLSCSLIETDEIWSYVGKKQARVNEAENAAGLGEAYTFVALAMPSRFVLTWKVGKRDDATADAFVGDLRARLVVMPAMTSDGFVPYIAAIGKHMGPGVDYGQTIKNYTKSGRRDGDHHYEPPRESFITKRAIFGAPDMDRATTAHVERHNGTMRHHIGRMRRLCYGFSKDPAHHAAAVALAYAHYNLCWIPKSLRCTPAMTAGVTEYVWELPEFMDAILTAPPCEAPERKPLAPRRPEGPARELPNGRGFLRLVGSAGGPSAPPAPAPTPPAVPVAPLPAVASSGAPTPPAEPTAAPPVDDRQLDLFAWRPKPREPRQLSLFRDD